MPTLVQPVPLAPDGRRPVVSSRFGEVRSTSTHNGDDWTYRRLVGPDPFLDSVPNASRAGEGFKHHAVPAGIPVLATAAGRVFGAGSAGAQRAGDARDNGLYVALDHGGGVSTYSVHLAARTVGLGDLVRAGDVIGIIGPSRNAGRHLHFEQRMGANGARGTGRAVNPAGRLAGAPFVPAPFAAGAKLLALAREAAQRLAPGEPELVLLAVAALAAGAVLA
jgi:murein DD-endopeptidase MepM/ murein hydrolase activator NlpD